MAHYLKNSDFERHIEAYRAAQPPVRVRGKKSKRRVEAENDLAQDFLVLSQAIVNYWHSTVLDPDDAVQECVLAMWTKMDRYKPDLGKAFNYFTSIGMNILKVQFRRAKRQQELLSEFWTHMDRLDAQGED